MIPKIGVVSLGCPKNQVDTEVLLGLLKQEGFAFTPREAEADLLLVNTCGFIQAAKEESIEAILDLARQKTEGRCRALVVAGCLGERYREDLVKELPEIDAIVGMGEYERIGTICRSLLNATTQSPEAPQHGQRLFFREGGFLPTAALPRLRVSRPHTAYLKLSEGCDHTCAFCAIPAFRGPHRSRPLADLLAEAGRLAREGVKELNLISQDTAHYGRDLGDPDLLLRLLRDLSRIEGVRWIRLFYLYPLLFGRPLLELMAEEPKICRYLDMPVQHADDRVLRLMRRGGSRAQLERFVEQIRTQVPGITLRTAVLVGHPGEDQAAFETLRRFLQETAFDHLGVFTFSSEEGTPAAALPDPVPAEVALERRAILMEEQASRRSKQLRALVGTAQEVLVDGPSEESEYLLEGRLEGQASEVDGVVYLTDAIGGAPAAGSFVSVRIAEAHSYDLAGRVVDDGSTRAA